MLFPDIEDNIPLPASALDALPELTPEQELAMRAKTIKLISDISGVPLVGDNNQLKQAEKLASQILTSKTQRPEFARYPNETIALLAGLVAQYNSMIVEELADLRLYVINKLVWEAEHAPAPKDRISALKALGDSEGIDVFKRRSEVTMKVQPIEEVERELEKILENVEYKVLDNGAENIRSK
jgi:hypothetical protein